MPNPRFNGYSFKDSFMSQFCDTQNAVLQEVLLCIAYGTAEGEGSMTPSEYFASVVMSESFDRDMDEYDKAMWRLIDDEEQPNTVICAHRGGGKTTSMQAKMARAICLRQHKYILYIQATHDDAAVQTENLKTELLSNDFITEHFGVMKATSFEDVSKDFSKKAWFACNPENARKNPGEPFCFVLPRGAGQRVRGRNISLFKRRTRPDLILVDDLEDDEEVLNEANREKLKKWYFGALLKTVRQDIAPDAKTRRWHKPADAPANWCAPYRVFHVDTLKHHDSLMANLLNLSHWNAVRFPAGVEIETEHPDGTKTYEYKTKRPRFRTDAQLAAEAEEAMQQGTLDVFCREMLCQPAARRTATFHRSMFQYYPREQETTIQNDGDYVRFVIVDPSKSDSPSADFTGLMAVAIKPQSAEIIIRRAFQERLTANQVITRAMQLAVETNSRIVCVEKIGMEGPQQTNWINLAASMEMGINLIWLGMGHVPAGSYGTGKDAIKIWRAQQIAPFYERREVWHHLDMEGGPLEINLLDYPRMQDFGLTDCVGYIPGVMAELGIVFGKQTQRYENVTRFDDRKKHAALVKKINTNAWACC